MIETELKRIADSLEIIAGVLDNWASDAGMGSAAAEIPLKDVGVVVEKVETPAPAPKAAAPAPAPKAAASAPKAAAPAPVVDTAEPIVQMTLPELDAALLAEYHRLNKDRTLIDGVIKGYGVNTATELAPADYQAVLDKVKAL